METRADEPLARWTTLRTGGPARSWLRVDDDADLVAAVSAADTAGTPVLVLGGGSNVVVSDEGFAGVVVAVATRGVSVVAHDDAVRVTAAAGEPWDDLVARAVDESWSGVEALSGIPGLVGATPIQNVGAYGQEVAATVVSVRVLDRAAGAVVDLPPADCGFGYRDSRFKREPDRFVVLGVTFELARTPAAAPLRYHELAERLGVATGATPPAAEVREAVLALRRGKGMVLDPGDHDTWSAGSFFTNPVLDAAAAAALPGDAPRFPAGPGRVKTSAAWLIERAGFGRGFALAPGAPAALSGKHTLAVTNRGSATTADLLALARVVRDGVQARFGIELRPEPVLVGVAL